MQTQQVSTFTRKQITRLINEAWANYELETSDEGKAKWAQHAFDLLGELPENEVTLSTKQ